MAAGRQGVALSLLGLEGNGRAGVHSPTFPRAGAPVALFTAPTFFNRGGRFHLWDVTPDGEKFLMVSMMTEAPSEPITVVLNWTGLLRK